MGAFFTALFTVLGQNIATLAAVAIGVFGLYCVASPKGRLIVKGFRNWIHSDATNNPKIAAGIFDEKLRELHEVLKKVTELNQKAHGALAELNSNIYEAERDCKRFTERAKTLEQQGDHNEAVLVARQAMQAKRMLDSYRSKLLEAEDIANTTTERVKEVQWKISDVKSRKQIALDNIKKGRLEQEISNELSGLNLTEIDSTLDEIETNSKEIKYIGVGARISYENSEPQLLNKAMDKADSGDAENFLKEIMEQK